MTTISDLSQSFASFKTSQGLELEGTLLHFDRNSVKFQLYDQEAVLRTSEILSELSIVVQNRVLYRGEAVTAKVFNAGQALICEAMLGNCWQEMDLFTALKDPGGMEKAFQDFFSQWQNTCRILPEYKTTLADFHGFLLDLRLWLEEVELRIRSSPGKDRTALENQAARQLAKPVLATLTHYFERCEEVVANLDPSVVPAHRAYIRRQLHPLLLCSPFLYRTYQKPLGYAGDYEMVNMILRDPLEGSSLYAKVINLWFLNQPPAEAHRNRIDYLVRKISEESVRCSQSRRGGATRILSVGCGPAAEIQRHLKENRAAGSVEFTLLDFNEETLAYARSVMEDLIRRHGSAARVQFVKKSVQQILKAEGKTLEGSPSSSYDLVYCAGLFDYLSDQVCQRLMTVLYDWTAPGGLLISTNVHTCNPRRLTMDYVMDWNLIYRDARQMRRLKPDRSEVEEVWVGSDATGVNTYAEVRKPAS